MFVRPLRFVAIAGAAALGLVGWYFFRPERAFVDARVSEPSPAATTSVLLEGKFAPRAHEGRGTAQLMQLPGGQRVLRFTGFETSNGPDVRIYLLGTPNAESNADLENVGFVDLGPMKGNVGDQNYDVPASVDLERYRAVSVWCRRFAVNFAVATLTPPAGGP